MNTWLEPTSAINHYYDSDFPSRTHCRYPENFDPTTRNQGLMYDVERYLSLAGTEGGAVLELCCGTGRVTLPLAEAGFQVTGVDFSDELLGQFRRKLERAPDLIDRVELVQQDVTQLDLPRKTFALAIFAFNSLNCITDFSGQRRALLAVSQHLRQGGLLVIDSVNPQTISFQGDSVPKPFFSRRNPHTGNRYTRFARSSPFDAHQCQVLSGWYDELDEQRVVRRCDYAVTWRLVFQFELRLMLESAGFEVAHFEGGHRGETFQADSPHMFVQARRTVSTPKEQS